MINKEPGHERVPLRLVYLQQCRGWLRRFDELPPPTQVRIMLGLGIVAVLLFIGGAFSLPLPLLPPGDPVQARPPATEVPRTITTQPPMPAGQPHLVLAAGTVAVARHGSGLLVTSPVLDGVRTVVFQLGGQFDALLGSLVSLGPRACIWRLPDGALLTVTGRSDRPLVVSNPPGGVLPLALASTSAADSCLIDHLSLRPAPAAAAVPPTRPSLAGADDTAGHRAGSGSPGRPTPDAPARRCRPLVDLVGVTVVACSGQR